MKTIKVTCAILIDNNKVLACQNDKRARHSLKWEFPGGKIEDFETEEECLKREIYEELSVDIEIKQKHISIFHDYEDFRLELIPFEAKIIKYKPIANVHKQLKWVRFAKINTIDWATTDAKLIKINAGLFQ